MKPAAECGNCISFVAESHATTLAEKARQSFASYAGLAGGPKSIDRRETTYLVLSLTRRRVQLWSVRIFVSTMATPTRPKRTYFAMCAGLAQPH